MTSNRRIVASIAGTIVVMTLLAPNLAGAAADKDVRVINTPAQAVPVVTQGTTQVAGTVTVGNTPTVNLAGTPQVVVSNSTANPVSVQEVGAAAEVLDQQFLAPSSNSMGEECEKLPVLAGKMLRVETISLEATDSDGDLTTDLYAYIRIDHTEGSGSNSVRIGAELTKITPQVWASIIDGPLLAVPYGEIGDSLQVCAGAYTHVRAFVTSYILS